MKKKPKNLVWIYKEVLLRDYGTISKEKNSKTTLYFLGDITASLRSDRNRYIKAQADVVDYWVRQYLNGKIDIKTVIDSLIQKFIEFNS